MTGAPCPVCGGQPYSLVRAVGAYRVLACGDCGLHYAEPMKGGDEAWYGGTADYEAALGSEAAATMRHVYADRLETEGEEAIWLGPNHLAFLARLPGRGGRLLDVGCGEGTFLVAANPHYAEARGIELDPRAAEHAERRLPGAVRRLRVEELDDEAGSYDVVTLFEVLEHLEDPLGALVACRLLLRAGGTLVVSVPHRLRPGADADPSDWPPNHLTRWTAGSLARALEASGFAIDRLHSAKRSRYGYWEAGWLLTSRFPRLLDRLGARGDVRRGRLVRRASGLLWIALWPFYAVTGKPTYGLYAEARPR